MAAAAYRAGVKLEDLRTAQVFDFTRRSGVVLAEIHGPPGADNFELDRSALWNSAEAAERRKDARTAREWVLALPAELSASDRAELARRFARELVRRYGVVADVAIHEPSRRGDDRNHHAHILCTTRAVLDGALSQKAAIELGDKDRAKAGLRKASEEITALREYWAQITNAALEDAGQQARIDHRSLVEQHAAALERGDLTGAFQLDRTAQKHVGVHAMAMDRRAGRSVSLRGQARERAVVAAHRVAFEAPRRAALALDEQREVARAALAGQDEGLAAGLSDGRHEGAESDPMRVGTGPHRVETGPDATQDAPQWPGSCPTSAQEALARDEIGPARPVFGPAQEDAATMRDDQDGKGEMSVPSTSAALRDEIAWRLRGLDERLDEAVPERAEVKRIASSWRFSRWRVELAGQLLAAARADLVRFDRRHPIRSLLDRLGLRRDTERMELTDAIERRWNEERVAVVERDRLRALGLRVEGRLPSLEAAARVSIEIQLKSDQRRLVALREALASTEPREPNSLAREVHDGEGASHGVAPNQADDGDVELDEGRVAAFVTGRAGVTGPAYCLQHAYDSHVRARSRLGTPGQAKPDEVLSWDDVAIFGGAHALAAGNALSDLEDALRNCWPGPGDRISMVLQHAQAQLILEQMRSAIEQGAEPITEGGQLLLKAIAEQAGESSARKMVAETLVAAQYVIAQDPVLRRIAENEQPAPGLR